MQAKSTCDLLTKVLESATIALQAVLKVLVSTSSKFLNPCLDTTAMN